MAVQRAMVYHDVAITSRRHTAEGFLLAKAALSRAGVFHYKPGEGNFPNTGAPVRVMRTEDSLFHPETLASFKAAVLTMDHPPKNVDSSNWWKFSIGNVTGEPTKAEGGLIESDIIIRDAFAIQAVDNGTRELSIGYEFEYEPAAESTLSYDYISKGPMTINHVALVDKGRAGERVAVYDKAQGGTMDNTDMEKITETVKAALADHAPKGTDTEAMAKAVTSGLTESLSPFMDTLKNLSTAMAERKKEEAIAKAKDAADKLKAETLTEERQRVAVLEDAKPLIAADKYEAVKTGSVKDILVAAVADAVPNASEQSEEYLRGVMAGMSRDRQKVEERRGIAPAGNLGDKDTATAYDAFVDAMTNDWKTPIGERPS